MNKKTKREEKRKDEENKNQRSDMLIYLLKIENKYKERKT